MLVAAAPENRTFGARLPAGLVEFAAVLERMVETAAPPDEGVRQLLHMSLANYAAGAIMMPYGRFLARRGASLRRSTGCAANSAPMSSRSRTA
jgi:predicted transcriptional regulator